MTRHDHETRPAADPASGARVTGPIDSGPGRLFTLLYGVFAVGATSRSVYQLATRASEAPFAYWLSALSALVYVVAFVLLLRWGHPGSRKALRIVCLIELTGVVVIGTLSLVAPQLFPHTTVWSYFGVGYLLMPAILPVLVLRWLKATEPAVEAPTA
ncbi:MAG: hypothetical protein Q4G51_06020 [Dermatophilus congolensis]|nr:hypothetical protein [Dermatophilus congolensis]